MAATKIACLWIPRFMLWTAYQRSPALREQPLVIGGAPSDFQKPALACSDSAIALGAAVGMSIRQIQARCPDVVCLPPDPDGDAVAFAPVLAIFDRFSPLVTSDEPGLAEGDVANLDGLFGTDALLAGALRAEVVASGHADVRIGIAANRFCARMAACSVASPTEPEELPNGRVVPAGGERAFLAPLPIDLLPGLPPETRQRLRFLGIETMGQFADLSRHAVMHRFGHDAGTAHELATGVDHRVLQPRPAPLQISEHDLLDAPEPRLDGLVFRLHRLMARLEARLRRELLVCRALDVLLELEHGEPIAVHIAMAQPTASARQLTDLVRWQLERRKPRRAGHARSESNGVVMLSVTVAETAPQTDQQLSLFGGNRERSTQVAQAIARLHELLGPEAVRRATLGRLPDAPGSGWVLTSRRPERAFHLEPYQPPDPRADVAPRPPLPPAPVPILRLLDPPRAIQTTLRDGQPYSVHLRQRREQVIACAGPWRLAEGWWAMPGRGSGAAPAVRAPATGTQAAGIPPAAPAVRAPATGTQAAGIPPAAPAVRAPATGTQAAGIPPAAPAPPSTQAHGPVPATASPATGTPPAAPAPAPARTGDALPAPPSTQTAGTPPAGAATGIQATGTQATGIPPYGGVERDYYQVLTGGQAAYLIYRDRHRDRWYVQGVFD